MTPFDPIRFLRENMAGVELIRAQIEKARLR